MQYLNQSIRIVNFTTAEMLNRWYQEEFKIVRQAEINQKLNILVTGSAGFIGATFCDEVLKLKHKVLGIDNFYSSLNLIHRIFYFFKLSYT